MGAIDKIKETLNSLRAYFGVIMVLMLTIGSGLVSSYRGNQIDMLFWIGFFVEIGLGIGAMIVLNKIKQNTNEIGEL